MNKKIRRVLFILGVGSGGILLLYQVYQGGLAISLTKTAFSSPIWLLAALFSALLMNLLQVFNWWNLMIGLGVKIDLLEAYRGYFLSFLPRYLPGTVWGYASRNEWLAQTHQTPAVITTTGSVLEIIVALLTAVLIVGLYGITSGTGIPPVLALGGILLLPWATWLLLKQTGKIAQRIQVLKRFFPALSRSFLVDLSFPVGPPVFYLFSFNGYFMVWRYFLPLPLSGLPALNGPPYLQRRPLPSAWPGRLVF